MNKDEAQHLLNKSREKIDELDDKILELILERTSLAEDIITSKKALNKELFDSSRENIIHNKIKNAVADKQINTDKVLQIFDLLASINKEEQEKYL
ncbi:chorismate mutase [Methanosphaera sp. ISO3-F5]|uniref:chorismate mutase n=1 Tax=Methanosphaera sp. ISO3-F5 TaxID=1452353 RepID=UPI002B25FF73|nr:chorismate mutase [Methanosphaera sp. ISO3-F5]WQH65013.1 chorismate mutase [Methanosphaera sp. ISO3-F5]